MVTTSLSAAPLQIGSDCDRQKLRLHWLQDGDEALPCARCDSPAFSSSASLGGPGVLLPSEAGGWCCEGGLDDEEPPVEDLGLISIIVLLVKQVHLQKVGAAV